MVEKMNQAVKIYLASITILFFSLLLLSIETSSMEKNSFLLGYSKPRLFLITFISFITILLASQLIKTCLYKKHVERAVTRLNCFLTKPNLYLFTKDFLFMFFILSITLVVFRLKYFGFLEYIWQPLPYYITVFEAYLVSIAIFSLVTILFLEYSSSVFRNASVKQVVMKFAKRFVIFSSIYLIAVAIYWFSSVLVENTNTPSYSYFPNLAEAFYNKELFISNYNSIKDLTFFNGKYYVSFPPLGALLMFPKVAATSRFGVNTVRFTIGYSALIPANLFLIYEYLRERKFISLNMRAMYWLIALLALGTSLWFMSTTGIIVHTAQILAAVFLSLSVLFIFLLKDNMVWGIIRSALMSGIALGLAVLSRPHIGFSWFFLLGIIVQLLQKNNKLSIQTLMLWAGINALTTGCFIVGLGYYNYARFGSFLDFGYTYMLVADKFVIPLQMYGQFNPHYIWQNIKANWLGLPYWHEDCNRLAPDSEGMSIFLTTPGILFLYRSWRKDIWIISGWGSIIAIIFVHLLYYNTGSHQFGYRFSLDFLIIVFCLLASGFDKRLPKYFPYLVVYSVIVNFIGVLWNAKQWCITW